MVIIDSEAARASTKEIMAMHLIEHDRSVEFRLMGRKAKPESGKKDEQSMAEAPQTPQKT